MYKNTAIIIGGTGQYGIILGNLLIKKNFNVIITGRNKKKIPKVKFFKTEYLQ